MTLNLGGPMLVRKVDEVKQDDVDAGPPPNSLLA
jgi:hypothetical protein